MSLPLIGRRPQISELNDALSSNRAELVALYGRRRVGKTFLVRQVYANRIVFEVSGLLNGNKKEQLQNFTYTLRQSFPDYPIQKVPGDWLTAFFELGRAIDALSLPEKSVLFFDELPWLASPRSGFLRAFANFWNSYVEKRNLVVVICGSAASWMIRKVVQDRGGLHNRITRLLPLAPFSLAETNAFCTSRDLHFSTYQLLQVYMTLGGVAAYLEQLRPGQSAIQNIQRICFSPTGFLRNEFERLFSSLFSDYERYVNLIRILAKKRSGMTRSELSQASGASSGGQLTLQLDELHASGFVGIYAAFDKKKKAQLYRLVDPYSLFYLTFIERLPKAGPTDFTQLSELPGWAAWSGYAFENVWLQHPRAIERALGITGIHTRWGTFLARASGEHEGLQIDLLIDRRDHTINLCEAKLSAEELSVNRALTRELNRKRSVFQQRTATKKQLSTVLLTVYGTKQSTQEIDGVDVVLEVRQLLDEL